MLMRVTVGKPGPRIRLWQHGVRQRLNAARAVDQLWVAKATPTSWWRSGAERFVIVHHQYVVEAKELLRPRCPAQLRKCLRKSLAVGRRIFG